MSENYGFTVRRGHPLIPNPKAGEPGESDLTSDVSREGWTVSLPHQCEEWEITEGYYEQTQQEAADTLREFIMQATEAWKKLTLGQEHGDD